MTNSSAPPTTSDPAADPTPVWVWALALLPFLALSAWLWRAGDGSLDDGWLYLMHAQALLEGTPYTQTNYVPSRLNFAPGAQPPGLPVTLAMVMGALGGYNEVAIRIVMLLSAIPFVLLPGIYFAKDHGAWVGVGITLFLGILHAWMSTRVLTDLGFASLIWAMIFLLDRTDRFRWYHVVAILVLGTGAMAYRIPGVAIVPAVALFALLNFRRVGMKPAVPALIWIAGGLLVVLLLGDLERVLRPLGIGDEGFLSHLVQRLRRVWVIEAAATHLSPFPGNLPNDVYHVASLGMAAVGLVHWSVRRWRSAAWLFALSYTAVLLGSWVQEGRYLIPLQPLLLFGLFWGIRLVAGRLKPAWSEVSVPAVALGVGALAIAGTVLEPPAPNRREEPETVEVLAFIRELANDVEALHLMAYSPRYVAWETGVPTTDLQLGAGASTEALMEEVQRLGVTHLVVDRIRVTPRINALLDVYECHFDLVMRNGNFTVFRVSRECPAQPA